MSLGKPERRWGGFESGQEGWVCLVLVKTEATEEDIEEPCASSALYTLVLQLSQTLPDFRIPLSSSLPHLYCPVLYLKISSAS